MSAPWDLPRGSAPVPTTIGRRSRRETNALRLAAEVCRREGAILRGRGEERGYQLSTMAESLRALALVPPPEDDR